MTEDPAPYGAAPVPRPESECLWIPDDHDDDWATACGSAFTFIDGGPPENDFRFCPYCGRSLVIAATDASDTAGSTAP